ncbi:MULTISPECIES: AsnC family transcriptional regulator [Thauera]|jgi:DNA-binding Lrp family transcriptional regulator|uniref:siroheme decarboxylase n=2 Tax=Thauera aminoaromatica TaxID=164330 RepID=C4K9Y7_THASP|nr:MULTISPECIES: AsnC family transcriptional regulator [Thauera]MDA0234257.1 AsnC family transcriptional regulator [Pseudomonadota bacterium]TMW78009.1 Lrp/AsnC family transcriptional regulator [Thauera sp. UPWRP]ACR01213.1 putative transcriptional regulator, AsnC family [Thauera aminoaromatica]ENO87331.1 AsnC family transcriptional regulator [Thauera aminoaromatica S2]KIN88261.1 asnC-type helix-turn-helix domain protein [Thauera sp. SWB20]
MSEAQPAASVGRRGVAAKRAPDDTDRRLINAIQGEFPLSERPFAEVGVLLGLAEDEVIARLQSLLDDRVLTRFGPMYQIERMGGAFCLAAIAVPEAQWTSAVEAVNAFPEVAHNYRREHALNMWFVLATETPEGIADCARRIEAATGLVVHLFPKEREYFVEMRLEA